MFNNFLAEGPIISRNYHFLSRAMKAMQAGDRRADPIFRAPVSASRFIREMPLSVEYLLLALGACFFIAERDLSSRIRCCERTNCLKHGACARFSERARIRPACRRIRQLHTYAHICSRQGGNGAYGTHLKNISGSPSAGAYRAPARCISRGIP
jgi:hypothetical protein